MEYINQSFAELHADFEIKKDQPQLGDTVTKAYVEGEKGVC